MLRKLLEIIQTQERFGVNGLTVREIAQELNVSDELVRAMVEQLEEQGYLKTISCSNLNLQQKNSLHCSGCFLANKCRSSYE